MRQKACDLCFTKKIKCDYAKPACSNCVLYRAKCQTSVVRSKSKLPKTVTSETIARRRIPAEPQEHMSARLKSLENRLDQMDREKRAAASGHRDEENQKPSGWRFNPLSPSLYAGPADEMQYLPPQEVIMPIIDLYFDTCNSVFPLFSRQGFMRSVNAWYSGSARDRPTWGSILVVIALGLQSRYPDERVNPNLPRTGPLSDYCLRNAQSILPELMARGDDLTGIRVVTALCILFCRTSDACPSVILMGMAAALCRRLQLHSHDAAGCFTSDETQQRSEVFWVLYILDQDVSLRAKTPTSLPGDSDIDVPLPRTNGGEIIRTIDQSAEIDIFRTRISLAKIEGAVYRQLYSVESRKASSSERRSRVEGLHSSLTGWYAQIPQQLQMHAVLGSVKETHLVHMTNLYHVYLLCLISTHGIYSTQADWLRSVGSLAQAAVQDFAIAMQGPRVWSCTQMMSPPLRPGWEHCVDVARGTIHLFQGTRPTEALAWQCSCAHFSALIILLADIVSTPGQPTMQSDFEAATTSTELFSEFFSKLVLVMETTAYKAIRRVITDLHASATVVVESHQSEWATVAFDGFHSESLFDLDGDTVDFFDTELQLLQ